MIIASISDVAFFDIFIIFWEIITIIAKNMYTKSFFIKKPVWNNSFSYDIRKNKQLFVSNIIEATTQDIALWKNIVFEDIDFSGKLQSCRWLEYIYKIEWEWKKIYLFDNHNHAYFFWHLAKEKDIKYRLIHIDEHSDMRSPEVFLDTKSLQSLETIFEYTNFTLNVWNYIIPAIHDWLIDSEVIQIRDSHSLEAYFDLDMQGKQTILNLDLDFFQPELDYIDYDVKRKVVLDAADKASIITVATSPFFINQDLAISTFKDLFSV